MGLSVKELYDKLSELIDEYGDLEVKVTYDSMLAATDISHKEPEIVIKPMREYSYVLFVGF